MATEKTDVVIVGVGAAGGILAAELGKAGMKVIGLERGPRLTTTDFNPHDELRYFQRQDLRPNIEAPAHHLAPEYRMRARRRSRCKTTATRPAAAPSTTVRSRGASTRTISARGRRRSSATARCHPGDSSLTDWPLSYADLEPYYDKAEYEIGVSGKAGNLQGRKIDGGNVFEAPRRREFPLPPLLMDQVGCPIRGGDQEARLSPVLDAARDPLAALQGPAGLHLLRLLPGVRLPRRREVEHRL